MYIDLDKLELLPQKTNTFQYYALKGINYWNLNKGDRGRYYSFDSKRKVKHPWKLSSFLILNNVGKSFALTYRYYLKKQNYKCRQEFLKYFQPGVHYVYGLGHLVGYRYNCAFIIDDNDLIQKNFETIKRNKSKRLDLGIIKRSEPEKMSEEDFRRLLKENKLKRKQNVGCENSI